MWVPTSREPVKETKRIWGCATRYSPTSPPGPGTKLTTPGGRPASCSAWTKSAPITGVRLDGLSRTVLPATIAAAVMPARMASGKFQGGTIRPTPSGREKRALSEPAKRGGGGGGGGGGTAPGGE